MSTEHTILIVDDQPENLATLGELLEPHYRVRAANSGERALQMAQAIPSPDLILLDVMMPRMDGYEVLAALRSDPVTREIPVIFVTSLGAVVDEEHGLKLGAVDYITKPIRPAILRARVVTQLENKQARDMLKDQNSWLQAEVERRMHDNELIQDVSLHALAVLAETRDNETGNHIRRTQSYVSLLVEACCQYPDYSAQLAGDMASAVVRAAPLHDIGKVGIPDEILRKPGRLSVDEYEIIKTHARIGADAIHVAIERAIDADHSQFSEDRGAFSFLRVAGQIARNHHERWDGQGYPDGLVGGDIPLPARIMAVADVYDALISRRVYKGPMAHQEAVEIIAAGRASQFDPLLVDLFLEQHQQFEAIALQYIDSV